MRDGRFVISAVYVCVSERERESKKDEHHRVDGYI